MIKSLNEQSSLMIQQWVQVFEVYHCLIAALEKLVYVKTFNCFPGSLSSQIEKVLKL